MTDTKIDHENLEQFKKDYNYGRLCGQLEAIALFNCKLDHTYWFSLNRYSKKEDLKISIEPFFKNDCEGYNLSKIEDPQEYLHKNILDYWFFAYQNTNQYNLTDEGNSFKLSDLEYKTEFVQDFINLLFDTIKPIGAYTAQMFGLFGHYGNGYSNIIFETAENDKWVYILHFRFFD